MSARVLLEVLLKFWGVVLLASALGSIPAFLYNLPESEPQLTHGIVARIAINAIVGVCLLLFARSCSRLLMPSADASRPEWPAGDLLEVALVVLGISLIVGGLKVTATAFLRSETRANWLVIVVSGFTDLLAGYLVLRFRHRAAQWLPGNSKDAA